jgi:hypothetical protein
VWGSEFTTKVATVQGVSAEITLTLNVKLRVLVTVVVPRSQISGTAEPNPLFESIWSFARTISNPVQRTLLGNFYPALWSSEMVPFLRGTTRAIASLGCDGAVTDARHRLKHVATRLPPAGPYADILCRNRRRHNNCVNLVSAAANTCPSVRLCVGPEFVTVFIMTRITSNKFARPPNFVTAAAQATGGCSKRRWISPLVM